jgi:cephalosporin hydroxylase
MSNFMTEVADRVTAISADQQLVDAANAFLQASILPKYSYNFTWQGRPIIQYPQDMVAILAVDTAPHKEVHA